MKGVTRSFWTLTAIVGVLEGYVVYLAVTSLRRVLPCWWAFVPHPPDSLASCGVSVPIFGYHNWGPAAVILAFFLVSGANASWTLVSQIVRTRRALRDFEPVDNKPATLISAEHGLNCTVMLVRDSRCFCCTAGSFFPKVIISEGMLAKLDGPQLVAVLAHEAEHVRRRDPGRTLAVRVASSAVFYVPLARFLAEKSLVSAELGADASAVKISGRKAMVGALIQVLGEARPALGLATEMASLNSLDLRIETLRTERLPRTRPNSLALGLTAVALMGLFALLLWVPATPTGIIHGSGLDPLSLRLLHFI